MDWSQFTFLIGSGVAIVMKQFFFKDDTSSRDKAIPIIVFISNLMARVAQELGGPSAPAGTSMATEQMLYATLLGFFGSGMFMTLKAAAIDSLMSYGLHRVKRWGDNVKGWKPAPRKRA